MKHEILPVTKQTPELQAVLLRLVPMYCHEWSQYNGIEVDEQGRFAFERYVPSYWEQDDRRAFLLRATAGDKPRWAGFALLDRDFALSPPADYAMAEFFVLHPYRRMGLGLWAALELMRRYQGEWEICRNTANLASIPFWDRVVNEASGGVFKVQRNSTACHYPNGTHGDIFRFRTAEARK